MPGVRPCACGPRLRRQTGRPAEITICNVIELRDGKVYREREYMDMYTMMTQMGVVKAPATAAGV